MRRAAALLVLVAALAATAQPAAAADRCKRPATAHTIAKSSRVLLYVYETRLEGPEGATYACNRRTGRRYLLDRPRDELYVNTGQERGAPGPRLEGWHLAYVTVQFEGSDGEYWRLVTLDVATAKKRALGSWSIDGEEFLHGFALTPSGAVAWHEFSYLPTDQLGSYDDVTRIWRYGAAGKELLDSARGYGSITDFGVSDARTDPRVYWMNGTTPRSAVLR